MGELVFGSFPGQGESTSIRNTTAGLSGPAARTIQQLRDGANTEPVDHAHRAIQQLDPDEELRLIQHLAPVGLLTLDSKGMVRQANRSACELMGMRQPICRVAPLAAYVDPGSCEDLFGHISRVFRGVTETSPPLRFRRRDGQINWIQLHSQLRPSGDGDTRMCYSALIDVTKQRRAEQAIRHSERSFRELLAQLPDGVVVLNGQTMEYANRRFARFVGERNPDRLTGCGFADHLHADDVGEFRQWIGHMGDATATHRVSEFRLVGRQSRILRCELTAIPMVLSGRLSMVLVVRDVTHARRLQADLEQANRLATVGVLAAGVAHEINNPLNYIMLNLEMVRRDLRADHEVDDLDDCLSAALTGTERVRDIVKSLNSFARVDQRPVRIAVRSVVDKASAMAAAEIRVRAQLVVDHDHSAHVQGVEGRLCQVMLNLLVNAAHAIDEGNADSHQITVRTQLLGDRVHITVSDTGCGIPGEKISKIFDPFYTTKPPGKGSGLGLTLCRNYIESHGGEIRVSSEPDAGTTFTIDLPAALGPEATESLRDADRMPARTGAASPRSAAEMAPVPADSPARARVLVVDDEYMICDVLVAVLGEHYEVVSVPSGNEALARLESEESFDLIICDLMMSDGSGMELHAALRERKPELARRLLFLTGGAHTDEAAGFIAEHQPRIAFKPLTRHEVLALSSSALQELRRTSPEPPAVN